MRRGNNKRGFFLTGPPGAGKTTLISRAVRELLGKGCRVEGILAPELRSGGRRVGFDLCSLGCKKRWPLARVGCASSVRVGRYGVCVVQAREAANHLISIGRYYNIIVIDEIGPMELKVPSLREAIASILSSPKPVIGVVHRRLRNSDPEIYRLAMSKGEIIWLERGALEKLWSARLKPILEVLANEACNNPRGEGSAGNPGS